MLTDRRFVCERANTLQKREFVNWLFNSDLYNQNGLYRKAPMFGILSLNHLKIKEKGLVIL